MVLNRSEVVEVLDRQVMIQRKHLDPAEAQDQRKLVRVVLMVIYQAEHQEVQEHQEVRYPGTSDLVEVQDQVEQMVHPVRGSSGSAGTSHQEVQDQWWHGTSVISAGSKVEVLVRLGQAEHQI
jgi:hypothetical protein